MQIDQRLDIEQVNILSLLLVVWKMSTGSSDLVPVVIRFIVVLCLRQVRSKRTQRKQLEL